MKDEESPQTNTLHTTPPRSPGRLLIAIAAFATISVVLVVARRIDPVSANDTVTPEGTPRRVLATRARLAAPDVELSLPGSTRAVQESLVVARASGYVSRLTVDLGDRVHAGQVLAELRAPETADELRAAEARSLQANESARWARENSTRTSALSGRGIVTQQENDDATLAAAAAEATLRASEADLARVRTLRRYQTVVAPFDGIVTEKLVEVGSLVSAGDVRGLFRVSSLERIKVVVEVPQIHAALVAPGQALVVERPDAPGIVVRGNVARVAGSLNEGTRTMRIEAELPGTEGLLGGMFVNVRLQVHRTHPPVIVPARALSVTGTDIRVWVVEGGKVRHRAITIARDLGREVELATGLNGNEMIVLSPPDGIADETPVEPVERPTPAAR